MVKIANTYGNDDDDNLRDLMSDQFIIIEGLLPCQGTKIFHVSFNMSSDNLYYTYRSSLQWIT